MPPTTDVTLPKGVVPQFPEKCIVCHAKPDSTIRIARNSGNPLLSLLIPVLTLFSWSRLDVPICQCCKRRFRVQRWGRDLFLLGMAILVIWWIFPLFNDSAGIIKKMLVAGLALLALSPAILAEMVWPRFFDTTVRKDRIDFEFASAPYAADFHSLNQSNIWSSDLDSDPLRLILARDKHGALFVFSSTHDATNYLEAFDVQQEEVEFIDSIGQRYSVVYARPPSIKKGDGVDVGVFSLTPTGHPDPALPQKFVGSASHLEHTSIPTIESIEALSRHLAKSS